MPPTPEDDSDRVVDTAADRSWTLFGRDVLEVDAVNGPVRVWLGSAARSSGRAFRVTRLGTSAHEITVYPYAAEFAAPIVLDGARPMLTLTSNGRGWRSTGRGPVEADPVDVLMRGGGV